MENLENVLAKSGLEQSEVVVLRNKFSDMETIANDWEQKAKAIVVKDETDIATMKMAKEARKFLSEKRIEIEKTRKVLKEQSLRKGQAIDAIAKYLSSLIIPIETHLREQEDYLKILQAKREEEERKRKEEQERIEQERLRLENERLQAELREKEVLRRIEEAKKEAEIKAKKEAEAKAKREAEALIQKVKKEEQEKLEIEKRKIEKEAEKRINAEVKTIKKLLNTCPKCGHKF